MTVFKMTSCRLSH